MEKIIAVAVRLPGEEKCETRYSLEELARLSETAGGTVVRSIIQTRKKFDPAFLIGKGKAQEIAEFAAYEKIRTVLFDNELSPAQQKNLEEAINAKIIDRTRLILDIFAMRARTREAALQIQLAQMSYYISRLTQKGIYLDNQVGGIGTRGPGERKLEFDRRVIRNKISHLKKEIEEVKKHREIQRAQRIETAIPTVALVGYTNAGKSTLLNTLVGRTLKYQKNPIYADDKLFATLDPTTRRIKLPSGRPALITDTVGFIRKLPHELVASFRSTLEEVSLSKLLLNVVDVSAADYEEMEAVVLKTLSELGAEKIPMIKVYNKIDVAPERALRAKRSDPEALLISAVTGAGIDELLTKIGIVFT